MQFKKMWVFGCVIIGVCFVYLLLVKPFVYHKKINGWEQQLRDNKNYKLGQKAMIAKTLYQSGEYPLLKQMLDADDINGITKAIILSNLEAGDKYKNILEWIDSDNDKKQITACFCLLLCDDIDRSIIQKNLNSEQGKSLFQQVIDSDFLKDEKNK